jgi:hypothetical protein
MKSRLRKRRKIPSLKPLLPVLKPTIAQQQKQRLLMQSFGP